MDRFNFFFQSLLCTEKGCRFAIVYLFSSFYRLHENILTWKIAQLKLSVFLLHILFYEDSIRDSDKEKKERKKS